MQVGDRVKGGRQGPASAFNQPAAAGFVTLPEPVPSNMERYRRERKESAV